LVHRGMLSRGCTQFLPDSQFKPLVRSEQLSQACPSPCSPPPLPHPSAHPHAPSQGGRAPEIAVLWRSAWWLCGREYSPSKSVLDSQNNIGKISVYPEHRGTTSRARYFSMPSIELGAVNCWPWGAIVNPLTCRGDPLTSGDHRRVADDGDKVPVSACLYAQHAEAVLDIVVGDPLDDPSQHLLSGLIRLNLHKTSITAAPGGRGLPPSAGTNQLPSSGLPRRRVARIARTM
jgi:hypothetical protein